MAKELKIGDNIKLGEAYYRITSKDPLAYKKAVTLAGSTSGTVQKFDTDLTPNREFIYHIIRCAVDGHLEFRLEFPEGVPHWTPHGLTQRLNKTNAGYPQGVETEMFIQNPYFPAFNINNPKTYSITADFWFWGWKYTVKQLIEPPIEFYEPTDYARGGGLG